MGQVLLVCGLSRAAISESCQITAPGRIISSQRGCFHLEDTLYSQLTAQRSLRRDVGTSEKVGQRNLSSF